MIDINDAYKQFVSGIGNTDVQEMSFRTAFEAEESEETDRLKHQRRMTWKVRTSIRETVVERMCAWYHNADFSARRPYGSATDVLQWMQGKCYASIWVEALRAAHHNAGSVGAACKRCSSCTAGAAIEDCADPDTDWP